MKLFVAIPVLFLACLLPSLPAQDVPGILIQPPRVILGDPFAVRLVNLSPGAEVTLHAELSGQGTYRSSATFEVGEDGTVDLATQAPVSGDYSGADPLGIFWSMREEGTVPVGANPDVSPDVSTIRFELRQGEEVVARAQHERVLRGPGVEVSEVRDNGLFATFCQPAGEGPHPGIILVGGSGGGIGWQRLLARLLATHGYAALGLAYFQFEELPANLEEIPLEYFGEAISWMRQNESVDPSRLAICGVSKGGELALAVGATFPEIVAVVAYVPASVVFQSIAPTWPTTTSWTLQGEGLPFVPYDLTAASSGADLLEIYAASLKNQTAVGTATIPVERIQGPILLLSGTDDTIWPSTAMSEAVVARLKRFGHPHGFEHIAYQDAGHSISRPWYAAQGEYVRNGGTPAGNARASVDAWQRVLAFFESHLKQ